MKRKSSLIAIIMILALAAGLRSQAEESTKEYHESWPAADVQLLEIDNKFGEIRVMNDGGGYVTIDVVITVEALNESKASELLSQLNVIFKKTGRTVSAETLIDSEFTSRNDFSIDYSVNIPSDKDLNISNKYGNTMVNILNANGTFDIQYGNFTANELNAPLSGYVNIHLAYGKADVSLSNDLDLDVKYSTLNFGETGDMDLKSKYTVINLGRAGSVKAEGKYDTYNFEEAGSIHAETKYTSIKIDELSESLEIDAEYGGIRVGRVKPGFSLISVRNSYGRVSLGLGGNSYSVDAGCDHCDISYPEDKFTGDKMVENRNYAIKGKIGDGDGGIVKVESHYGQIRLY
jgi:hydrogenase maturation factor